MEAFTEWVLMWNGGGGLLLLVLIVWVTFGVMTGLLHFIRWMWKKKVFHFLGSWGILLIVGAVCYTAIAAVWLWRWLKRAYRRDHDRICEWLRIPINKRYRLKEAFADNENFKEWNNFLEEKVGVSLRRPEGWKPVVGDKVRIRQWQDMVDEFGTTRGVILCRYKFSRKMKKYCGRIFKVGQVDCDGEVYFTIAGPGVRKFHWHIDMLEPV